MKLNNVNYNEYIRVFYSGLKEFEYKENNILYRGTNISEIEVNNIINFYNNMIRKKEDNTLYLMYSRAFLSFSKRKEVCLSGTFIKDIPNTRKILFELKNNLDNKLLSNANLYKISAIPSEDEILFFPFSAFIIDDIKLHNITNIGDIFFISLKYLGLYEERIKKKAEKLDKIDINTIIMNSNFSKDAFKLKIIPKQVEKMEKKEDNFEENLINEIIKINNKQSKETNIINSNEIHCIYKSDKDEINLLNNCVNNKEINNQINKYNIDIFINDNQINFCYVYKTKTKEEIKVQFKFKKLLTNMSYIFYNCSSLKSIDLSSFNSLNVTNMSFMFYKCSSLESIDFSTFNTSKVTNMSSLFRGCSSLQYLNLNSFNTSNVKYMGKMFSGCTSLENLYLFSFDTRNVVNMESMFENCSSLKSINLYSFNTKNVINMSGMFYKCSSLEVLDLSSFNTENVTNMASFFQGCSSLEFIDITSFNTTNVKDMSYMFCDCSFLTSSDFSKFYINDETKTTCIFYNCDYLLKKFKNLIEK